MYLVVSAGCGNLFLAYVGITVQRLKTLLPDNASCTQLSALPFAVRPTQVTPPFCTSVSSSAQYSTHLIGLMGGSVVCVNTLSAGLARSKFSDLK